MPAADTPPVRDGGPRSAGLPRRPGAPLAGHRRSPRSRRSSWPSGSRSSRTSSTSPRPRSSSTSSRRDRVLADSTDVYAQARQRHPQPQQRGQGASRPGITRDAVAAAYDGPLDPDDVKVEVEDTTSDVAKVSVTGDRPRRGGQARQHLRRGRASSSARAAHHRPRSRRSGRSRARSPTSTSASPQIRQPLTDVEAQLPPTRATSRSSPGATTSPNRWPRASPRSSSQRTPYQQQLENLRLAAGFAQSRGSSVLTAGRGARPTRSRRSRCRTALLALVVGLLLGVVLAFVRDNLDERIRGIDDLDPGRARAAHRWRWSPRRASAEPERSSPMRDDAPSLTAEAYRSLRTSVKFAGLDQPIQVIQVTSALPGEGKTTTVANLAEALAQGGERVAIVCCDLRRPRHPPRTSARRSRPGFTDVLLGEPRSPRRCARSTSGCSCCRPARRRRTRRSCSRRSRAERGDPGAGRRSSTW